MARTRCMAKIDLHDDDPTKVGLHSQTHDGATCTKSGHHLFEASQQMPSQLQQQDLSSKKTVSAPHTPPQGDSAPIHEHRSTHSNDETNPVIHESMSSDGDVPAGSLEQQNLDLGEYLNDDGATQMTRMMDDSEDELACLLSAGAAQAASNLDADEDDTPRDHASPLSPTPGFENKGFAVAEERIEGGVSSDAVVSVIPDAVVSVIPEAVAASVAATSSKIETEGFEGDTQTSNEAAATLPTTDSTLPEAAATLPEAAEKAESQKPADDAAKAVDHDEQDDHDAAQVLMCIGKQPYAEKDLAAALPNEQVPEEEPLAEGRRAPSKRKRIASIRVTNDLEPSIEEQNWGKGRGRRRGEQAVDKFGKKLTPQQMKKAKLEQQLNSHSAQRNITGRPVTLQLLRALRDAGHSPIGMDLLVYTPDQAGRPAWHFAQVQKCDLDFKKAIVRVVPTGNSLVLNWHLDGTDERVAFPVQQAPNPAQHQQMIQHMMAQQQHQQHDPAVAMMMQQMAKAPTQAAQMELAQRIHLARLQQMQHAQALAQANARGLPPLNTSDPSASGGYNSQVQQLQAYLNQSGVSGDSQMTPQLQHQEALASMHQQQHSYGADGTRTDAQAAQGQNSGSGNEGRAAGIQRQDQVPEGSYVHAHARVWGPAVDRPHKTASSSIAIADALGISDPGTLPSRNPQVKLRADMFDALRNRLRNGQVKIMCKVTAQRGLRTAVLTGVSPTHGGLTVKYLDAQAPAEDVIMHDDLTQDRIVLEITQVVNVYHT